MSWDADCLAQERHHDACSTRGDPEAQGSDHELARQFNVSRDTIRKWRKREVVHDTSHTAHRLQTTLNAGQEELVVYLRTKLLLPLDDLLAVVHEFIEPAMSHLSFGGRQEGLEAALTNVMPRRAA